MKETYLDRLYQLIQEGLDSFHEQTKFMLDGWILDKPSRLIQLRIEIEDFRELPLLNEDSHTFVARAVIGRLNKHFDEKGLLKQFLLVSSRFDVLPKENRTLTGYISILLHDESLGGRVPTKREKVPIGFNIATNSTPELPD